MNDKIKKVICDYLVKDLYKVEIIYYRDSIWFIDRENRYWYFEYHKVDKHLWWRWSHFTQALKIFSMDAEKEQSIFGELVNIILTKKQKLESKYPNKIFKTIGSVMNFEDNDGVVTKNEIKTTDGHGWKPRFVVDEVLNNEVETTRPRGSFFGVLEDEVLNNEVETTNRVRQRRYEIVDKVLNSEVETTSGSDLAMSSGLGEVLNNEVETICNHMLSYRPEVDKVLNCEVEKIDNVGSQFCIEADAVITFEVETTKSGELIEEDKIIGDVLEIQNIQPTERGSDDRMLDFVLEVEDYNPETTEKVIGNLKREVNKVLESTVEINSIEKLKGENPFQDIIVSHILDESDKVTDKLKMKEDDYVKTYSHDVYMCDHLVQNVLDVGVNSIHYDAEPHTQLVDGILKKA